MIQFIKYHFRLSSQAIEFYLAQVLGNKGENISIDVGSLPQMIPFTVYRRNGYLYIIMDQPEIDYDERIK